MSALSDFESKHGRPQQDSGGTTKVDFRTPVTPATVNGKTAIITGGASGIGLGIATSLAENGARVALLDLNELAGENAEKAMTGRRLTAKFIRVDVTSWDSQLAAFKEVLAWSGNQLDIVVLAAGLASHSIVETINLDPDSDPVRPPMSTLDVNLTGSFYSTHLALAYFSRCSSQRKDPTFRPQLLFICSIAGYRASPGRPDYTASKFGVRAIWKSLDSSSERFGDFQTNLLAPTFIRTPMISDFWVEFLERKGVILGNIDDVVAAAMRCICNESVEKRAICVVRGTDDEPGSRNFDLEDDMLGGGCGRVLSDAVKAGLFEKPTESNH